MTQVYLLRHGQVDADAGLYGKTDVAVTLETNIKIMAELLKHQHHFTDVVSSPLRRCSTLAKQFSSKAQLRLTIIDDFQEMDFGALDGRTFDEISLSDEHNGINKIWHSLERFWQAPAVNHLPEAELLNHFNQRIGHAWSQLLKKYQGKTVLLVTHGGVIRTILANILELDHGNPKLYSQLSIDYASVTHIDHYDESNISRIKNISMPLAVLACSSYKDSTITDPNK